MRRCNIDIASDTRKRKEYNWTLILLFIDYEKSYDNVRRDVLWKVMENEVTNLLLKTKKYIYKSTNLVSN